MTEISLLLELKQSSNGKLNSAISQLREAYCRYKSQNWFHEEKMGNLSARNVNGFPQSVLHSGISMDMDKPHIWA
jgi:hypothetical protein